MQIALVDMQRRVQSRVPLPWIQPDPTWLTEQQHQDFLNWQLTAQTYFAPEGWRELFAESGYSGDYYWTLTE